MTEDTFTALICIKIVPILFYPTTSSLHLQFQGQKNIVLTDSHEPLLVNKLVFERPQLSHLAAVDRLFCTVLSIFESTLNSFQLKQQDDIEGQCLQC
uniref:Uncharacterized protein n=1 Tax=Romanomermis culicivorax TaxID=13658 RepID=A0A915K7D3_ROMCU